MTLLRRVVNGLSECVCYMEEFLVNIGVNAESRVAIESRNMYLCLKGMKQYVELGYMNFDCVSLMGEIGTLSCDMYSISGGTCCKLR